MPQHLFALLAAERLTFATQEANEVVTVLLDQRLRRWPALELTDRVDDVVLGDEIVARRRQRRPQARDQIAAE